MPGLEPSPTRSSGSRDGGVVETLPRDRLRRSRRRRRSCRGAARRASSRPTSERLRRDGRGARRPGRGRRGRPAPAQGHEARISRSSRPGWASRRRSRSSRTSSTTTKTTTTRTATSDPRGVLRRRRDARQRGAHAGAELAAVWASRRTSSGRRSGRSSSAASRTGASWERIGVERARGHRLRGRRSLRRRRAVPAPRCATAATSSGLAGNMGRRWSRSWSASGSTWTSPRPRTRWGAEKPSPRFFERLLETVRLRSRARSRTSATGSTTTSCRGGRRDGRGAHPRGPWGYLQSGAEQAALRIRSLDELPAAFAVSDCGSASGSTPTRSAGGEPLVLGGVEFTAATGLAGHSDGDVVTHALIDALLGAANMGDIGDALPVRRPRSGRALPPSTSRRGVGRGASRRLASS